MKRALLTLLLCLCTSPVIADQDKQVYEGTWRTTNRKLDGKMTCVVTEVANEKWRGRFYGVWQGVAFDYVVDFAGPPSALQGTAQIDGANYVWTGELSGESFEGKFGGNRYTGYFKLEKAKRVTRSEL